MGNKNRKATKEELEHAQSVICEAFPDMVPVFGAHSDYGGHRAPRDHTIAFRLQDERGKFRSNGVWLMPDSLATLTVGNVRAPVAESNGKRQMRDPEATPSNPALENEQHTGRFALRPRPGSLNLGD